MEGGTRRRRNCLLWLVAFFAVARVLFPSPSEDGDGLRFPEPPTRHVHDLADILSMSEESALDRQCVRLQEEDGAERVIVTLDSLDHYGFEGDPLDYATALGNEWGLGDAKRDDGILVLVVPEDRRLAIALGLGFGHAYDDAMKQVFNEVMVPHFREGRFADGLREGEEAITRSLPLPIVEAPETEPPP